MGLILGIMGWFASGKSSACDFFVKKGFYEIDVDHLGKIALNIFREEVVRAFGEEILDGDSISPKKLGNRVFCKLEEMKKLNRIVHRWMREKVKEEIQAYSGRDILVNAAILPQMKLESLCNRILMIDAPEEILVQRGQARNNFSPQKVLSILEIQKSNNDYFKVADDVIRNDGTLKEFYEKLKAFYQKIKEGNHDTGR